MNAAIEFESEEHNSSLPFERDLVERQSSVDERERRLLWAVLEDGIRTYLANCGCTNRSQRREFEEVRRWFEPAQATPQGLFGFRGVCSLLGVDADRILRKLKALECNAVGPGRHRPVRIARPQTLAA